MKKCDIDAIILCGGLGMRLRSVVPDVPKVLAQIRGEACLDIIAGRLFHGGISRLILATGYLSEQIEAHVARTLLYQKKNVVFSKETNPLGTGGALKQAIALVESDSFFVINGDTPFRFSLWAFFQFHREKDAALSVAIFPRKEEDAGGVLLGAGGKIVDFKERAGKREMSFSSGGVYLLEKEIAKRQMPRKKSFSIEYDFFPRFVKKNPSFGFESDGDFFDIGTPERYRKAQESVLGWGQKGNF